MEKNMLLRSRPDKVKSLIRPQYSCLLFIVNTSLHRSIPILGLFVHVNVQNRAVTISR